MTQQKTPLDLENKKTVPAKKKRETYAHTLRGRIAQLQCSMVRLHHKLHKRSRAQKRASLRRLRTWPLYILIGELLYSLGFQGEYAAVRFARWCKRAAAVAHRILLRAGARFGRFFGKIGRTLREDLITPVAVFFRGIIHIFRYAHQVRKEKGFPAALWEGLCYLGRGIKLYARLVPHTVAYIVPAAVLVVCLMYVHQIENVDYTLAVQVNGNTVGYVESENVFENAKTAVDERINYAGTSQTSWNITPTYTLARTSKMNRAGILSENEMADAILESSSNEIAEGTALYIDGSLCKVTTEGKQLSEYLENLKAPYEQPDDPNTVVQFNHDVELVDGVFFNDSFSDYQDILNYISADQVKQQDYTISQGDSISLIASKNGLTMNQLYELNPGLTEKSALFPGDKVVVQKQEAVLEVRVLKTTVEQETIPFDTETSESADYSFGTTKTIQEGADGLQNVTYQYTYDAAGNTLDVEVLNKEVVQEPVTKKVVKGTKTALGTIAKVGNGSLMWPVPGYRYCSRWAVLPGGHKGVDICAAAGTPILAADSGVVVASGFSAAGHGYGNSIIIDHGNGYKTLYGHCLTLNVSVGQAVAQGQVIGTVGSTGRSTGNHCHFEIFYNGSRLAPQSIFGGK
ncbi:MAG: peptidoglycan DD-metalloendopeptidase family protein [Faecalibacterium sp.]|nr:peptidoglycan DD-metalloendopeptidase family protein [Faecalibacterium sp.]